MHEGPVPGLFVDENPLPIPPAFPDHLHKDRSGTAPRRGVLGFAVAHVKADHAAHEAAKGMIAADKPDAVTGRVELDNRHGDRIKCVLKHIFVHAGHERQVIEVDSPHGIVITGLFRVFKADLESFFVPLQDLIQWNRLQVIVALQLRAADGLQKANLFFRLHAFAYGIHAQGRGHLHQLGQYDLAAVTLLQLPHEAHIKLDKVKLYALQNIQRGIAAAKIIHPDGKSQAPEPLDLRPDELKVAADDALRDLDRDHVPADTGIVHPPANLFHHVAGVEIGPGKVDGLGDNVQSRRFHVLDFFQHLIQHAEIQLVDHTRAFQRRYKVGGRQESLDGIDPPGQRLFVTNPTAHGPDNRLKINLYPSFRNRPVKVRQDILATGDLVAHFIAVKPEAGDIRPRNGVAGAFCPVTGHTYGNVFNAEGIDTHPDRQRITAVERPDLLENPVQDALQTVVFGKHDKAIRVDVAAVLNAEGLFQYRRKGLQELVALRKAVIGIVVLHAIEVHIQQCRFLPLGGEGGFTFLGQREEMRHIGQPCQVVIIIGFDNALLV